ncbi:MAG: amidohydrolase family protein [Pseudomonadota bacterium]
MTALKIKRPAVIDAHHHIWRQADLPWLLGPERPRIFGPYAGIKRDYLIDDYLADLAGEGVVASVYVQANWAPNWAADEAAWVQSVAEAAGWPHAIVGYADFTAHDLPRRLDRLAAAAPLMRGVRQQLHWHASPHHRFAPRPDLAEDPTVRANIARLADHGWSFELQVFAPQMKGAAGLAQACPKVTFILQHAGMLEDLTDAGWQAWRAGMQRLAAQPNVVAKLSAFGTFLRRNDPDLVADLVAETVDLFGEDRCLWGSNFPIEKLWASYGAVLAAHDAATAQLGEAARLKIFHDNARRIYRLQTPKGGATDGP